VAISALVKGLGLPRRPPNTGRPPRNDSQGLLAVLSAVLYILAFPNFNLSWGAWFALVPLILSLSRSPTPSRAFFTGWLAGTLAYAGILFWIIATFRAAHLTNALAGVCLFLLSAYLGLYWGIWAWLLHKKQSIFFGAAAWVALEYVRTYMISGFPWVLLAESQVKNLPHSNRFHHRNLRSVVFGCNSQYGHCLSVSENASLPMVTCDDRLCCIGELFIRILASSSPHRAIA
jgi:hypothetical protein